MDEIDERSMWGTIIITIFSFLILVWQRAKEKKGGEEDERKKR